MAQWAAVCFGYSICSQITLTEAHYNYDKADGNYVLLKELELGEWDVCDTTCASSTAYRSLICRNETVNIPVPLTSCDYSINNFQVASKAKDSKIRMPWAQGCQLSNTDFLLTNTVPSILYFLKAQSN